MWHSEVFAPREKVPDRQYYELWIRNTIPENFASLSQSLRMEQGEGEPERSSSQGSGREEHHGIRLVAGKELRGEG